MKSLFYCALLVISAGNLYSQADKATPKPTEKPQEKPDDKLVPVLMEPQPPAPIAEPDGEQPFSYVEQMPQFPEGQEAMYKFIYENLNYPELAKQNGVSGQVIVQFVITSDGTLSKAKVIRGIGSGCNEEALRVVNAMPNWNPGKHNGRAVPVVFTLPIKFVIQ